MAEYDEDYRRAVQKTMILTAIVITITVLGAYLIGRFWGG